jgi:hypothetical protein
VGQNKALQKGIQGSKQALAQSNFFIVNPIQIQHKNMIENPNPNPLFKMN